MCVRPQTYESEAEAEILSYVFAGRSGLENTSFALLDPNGKKITRGSRSPGMTYGSAERFAEALAEVAKKYDAKARPISALPTVANLRLALNVAAADMRPLVIVRAEGAKAAKAAKALAARVAEVAWSEDAVGACHYVVLDEESTVAEFTPELGVTVVQPDPYGRGGDALAFASVDAKVGGLAKAVSEGLEKHDAEAKEHDDHLRQARREGIRWETAIPVSDSHKGDERKRRDR